MMPFNLKIVTPDGLFFDGQAEQLIVRTITGDIGIMARHMNYLSPLGMGRAVVISDGHFFVDSEEHGVETYECF